MLAALLEGVACLLWTVTLRLQRTSPNVPPVVPPATPARIQVMPSHELEPGSRKSVTGALRPQASLARASNAGAGDELTRLRQAIAAGELRPTVTGIRQHLGCSQAKASALRRQLVPQPSIS